MLAMQYSIPLPPNHDAALIRRRVEARSTLFDGHSGLVHKSFLYNQKENFYAPFYVWRDVIQARDFLLDDLFKGVIDTFSRHRVRSWFVLHMAYGNRSLKATHALREIDVVPPDLRLEAFVTSEKAAQQEMLADPNLYLHLTAFDADRWEVLRFSLWKDKGSAARPVSDAYLTYDVLHVSEPSC
ncbi:MAG: DUF4865 family protein [Pseudomonadota bacterium]|nr:DUF4865 family protein [Pseudomonadota bacterium]